MCELHVHVFISRSHLSSLFCARRLLFTPNVLRTMGPSCLKSESPAAPAADGTAETVASLSPGVAELAAMVSCAPSTHPNRPFPSLIHRPHHLPPSASLLHSVPSVHHRIYLSDAPPLRPLLRPPTCPSVCLPTYLLAPLPACPSSRYHILPSRCPRAWWDSRSCRDCYVITM